MASGNGDAGLVAGLQGLSEMLAGTGPLEQFLTAVAELAVTAVPGADGTGVTVVEAGHPDTSVASHPFVRELDAIAHRVGEGPAGSTVAAAGVTGSGSLGADSPWPRFGPPAADLGVHSVVSLPLVVAGDVIGALVAYAHARNAFGASARRLGGQFAAAAAVAIHNARRLEQSQRLASQLESALAARATIDQAVGILMSRSGISAAEAFGRLRVISQHDHVKVSLVAARLVDEAVRRAQARVSGSGPRRQ